MGPLSLRDLIDSETVALDHAGLGVLSSDVCFQLMESSVVGRVAFVSDGEVVVLPVNYATAGTSVVFRSAVGSKLSAAVFRESVSFEVDSFDPVTKTGWSVLITGVAETVVDGSETEALEKLRLAPWADTVERPFWIRIVPNSVSGRVVVRSTP